MSKPLFIVDGNNVAFQNSKKAKKAILERILSLINEIRSIGSYIVFFTTYLLKIIDEPKKLKDLSLQNENFVEIQYNEDTDRYILEASQKLDGYVISNDRFREYEKTYSKSIEKRLPFKIIQYENRLHVILPWLHQFKSNSVKK